MGGEAAVDGVSKLPSMDASIGLTHQRLEWEHSTWGYMVDLIRSTFMLLKPNKLNSNLLKEGRYLHVLLAYIVGNSTDITGEPRPIEEFIVWCKTFANECRERFVDSNIAPKAREHPILDACPRKMLAQLSTWMKSLPTPFEGEMDLNVWRETFAPTKDLNKMLSTQVAGLADIENLHRISSQITPPPSSAWVKRAGCLERDVKTGGSLSLILSRIPSEIVRSLPNLPLLDRLELLPRIFSKLWEGCLEDVRVNYAHDCSPSCQQARHTPILHSVVMSRGWKNRHLSMNYSPLQFLSSVLQVYVTKWLANMPGTAEGLESFPRFVEMANTVYRSADRKARHGFITYILSGDLSGCTNHYIPKVSQEMTLKGLRAVLSWVESQHEMIVRTALGRYDIFFPSLAIAEMRSNKDSIAATEALMDIEDSPTWRLKQLIGQHMSQSLSYPVMGGMHQSVFDIVEPDKGIEFDDSRVSNKSLKQFIRRLRQGGGKCTYIFGLNNDGSSWVPNLSHLGEDEFIHVYSQMLMTFAYKFHSRFIGYFKKQESLTFGWEAQATLLQESQLRERGLLSKHERETGSTEYKAPQSNREYEAFRDVNILGMSAPSLYKLAISTRVNGKFRPLAISVAYSCWDASKRKRIFTSCSALREHRPSLFSGLTDGDYRVESMTLIDFATVNNGQITWKNKAPGLINRLHYMTSVGDDHLVVTRDPKILDQYQAHIVKDFNQEYNQKANYVSTSGLVIAERLAVVDNHMNVVRPQPYIKVKQLVVERGFGAGSSWMERAPAIRQQMLNEFSTFNVDRLNLYRMIENAEKILYWNNITAIEYMIENSIDPRLPVALGGQNIWKDVPKPIGTITRRHLTNLRFLHTYSRSYFPVYVKLIRKASQRVRAVEKTEKSAKLYKPGPYPVKRETFKRLMYRLLGFVDAMKPLPPTEELSYRGIADEVRACVNLHYAEIAPRAYTLESVAKATGNKSIYPFTEEQYVEVAQVMDPVHEILKYIDDDPRVLRIDLETLKVFNTLQAQEESIGKEIARSRDGEYRLSSVLAPVSHEQELSTKARFALQDFEHEQDELELAVALNLTREEKGKVTKLNRKLPALMSHESIEEDAVIWSHGIPQKGGPLSHFSERGKRLIGEDNIILPTRLTIREISLAKDLLKAV